MQEVFLLVVDPADVAGVRWVSLTISKAFNLPVAGGQIAGAGQFERAGESYPAGMRKRRRRRRRSPRAPGWWDALVQGGCRLVTLS